MFIFSEENVRGDRLKVARLSDPCPPGVERRGALRRDGVGGARLGTEARSHSKGRGRLERASSKSVGHLAGVERVWQVSWEGRPARLLGRPFRRRQAFDRLAGAGRLLDGERQPL